MRYSPSFHLYVIYTRQPHVQRLSLRYWLIWFVAKHFIYSCFFFFLCFSTPLQASTIHIFIHLLLFNLSSLFFFSFCIYMLVLWSCFDTIFFLFLLKTRGPCVHVSNYHHNFDRFWIWPLLSSQRLLTLRIQINTEALFHLQTEHVSNYRFWQSLKILTNNLRIEYRLVIIYLTLFGRARFLFNKLTTLLEWCMGVESWSVFFAWV